MKNYGIVLFKKTPPLAPLIKEGLFKKAIMPQR